MGTSATTQNITVTLQPNPSGGWIAHRNGQPIQGITVEGGGAALTFVLDDANAVFAVPGVDWGSGKPDWISDLYEYQSGLLSLAIANNGTKIYPSLQLVLESPPGGARQTFSLPIELQPEGRGNNEVPEAVSISPLHVEVFVTEDHAVYRGDVKGIDSIPVQNVAALIQFILKSAPDGWCFSKEPIDWGEDGTGVQPPSFSKALNVTPTSFALLDINNNRDRTGGTPYPFDLVLVDAAGILYRLRGLRAAEQEYDPTIINQQPDPVDPIVRVRDFVAA